NRKPAELIKRKKQALKEAAAVKKEHHASVHTPCKPAAKEVHPAPVPLKEGFKSERREKAVGPGDSLESHEARLQQTTKEAIRRFTPERVQAMKFGMMLTPEEKNYYLDMLNRHPTAVAFVEEEKGILRPHMEEVNVIHTVPHKPWQKENWRQPMWDDSNITKLVSKKIKSSVLEYSCGPYGNRFFAVAKKILTAYHKDINEN
ncbi:hypothetical protein HK104_007422, partial [Borealophlyctis nickersoniae]